MAQKKESSGNSNQGAFALLIILLFFLALIDISSIILLKPSLSPSKPSQSDSKETAKVSEVLDGETFTLDSGDTVKLIGIDAPESGGKYYDESTRFLGFLIANKSVTLEKDVEDKDSSGRLLRYVYVNYNGQQVFVNLESVRQGYSLPFHIGANVKYRAEIEQARAQCISEQLNLCGSI